MSVLIFLLVLFVLILVHELGHFTVAKLTGMRVDEFGIGFPPRIARVKKGETVYSLNIFPVGGFVKIYGENSEDVDNNIASPRSFTSRSKWAQTAVLLAGVTMNILLAWVLFVVVYAVGVQTAVSETDASAHAQLVVADVLPGSPAAEAGLPAGARVVSLTAGSDHLTQSDVTPTAFRSFVTSHGNEPITVAYDQGSRQHTVVLTPKNGVITDEPEQAAVGVQLALLDTVSYPLPSAIYHGTVLTFTTLRDITVGLFGLLNDALHLRADLSQVAGPVGIVGLVGEASAFGITALLMFTAFISLNLAIINLFPFPALDGGRLLFVAIEALKGAPIRPARVALFNTVGFVLLITLMVAVTLNDILRLF